MDPALGSASAGIRTSIQVRDLDVVSFAALKSAYIPSRRGCCLLLGGLRGVHGCEGKKPPLEIPGLLEKEPRGNACRRADMRGLPLFQWWQKPGAPARQRLVRGGEVLQHEQVMMLA